MAVENRPVWLPSGTSTELTHSNRITHEDEGRVEIFIVLLRIASIELVGLLAADGKEGCAGIV